MITMVAPKLTYMSAMPQRDLGLHSALTRARTAAERHMTAADRVGISWREETISELLWVNAQPHVSCADFTHHEESVVGADWLWWWVDSHCECFGMLVQAKRLHHRHGQPQLYLNCDGGWQMTRLLSAARELQVPAVYALYFGGTESRRIVCSPEHTSDCERCRRASVSLTTALQAQLNSLSSPRDAANMNFRASKPLEDFVTPAATDGPVKDLNLDEIEPRLREFLLHEQMGARHVARELFRLISVERAKQLSADVADRVVKAPDPVFTDLPLDRGHFTEPYFPYIFRGLRGGIPDYVNDVLAGQPPPSAIADKVGGVVVLHC
jgi:hypothetical protein